MKKLLIYSVTYDIHSSAVAVAMGDMGWKVDLIHGMDFPSRSTQTATLGPDQSLRITHNLEQEITDLSQVDVVWNRRFVTYNLPKGCVHEADFAFADREASSFSQNIQYSLAEKAFWVNPYESKRRARSKLLQLKLARDCGLKIPKTLFTNNLADAVEFARSNPNGTIYKPQTPASWISNESSEKVAYLYTSKCDADDLLAMSPESLQLCPGIFQELVEKEYEVRSTFFGHFELSIRLDSQSVELGKLDWRRGQELGMPYSIHVLPADIRSKCIILMERLGIVTGSFDFMVDEEGDYVFLEVNESGQFLWLEQRCPEIPALDTFCKFLESRNPTFPGPSSSPGLRFGSYKDEARVIALMKREVKDHLMQGAWHVAKE